MDRNSIFGLLLIGLILVWYSVSFSPDKEEATQTVNKEETISQAPPAKPVDTAQQVTDSTINQDSVKQVALASKFGVFGVASRGTEGVVEFENEVFRGTISKKGGRISKLELKNHKAFGGKPLVLFNPDSAGYSLNFTTSDAKVITTDSLYFTPSVASVNVSGEDSATISMKMQVSADKYIEYVYTIKGSVHDLGFKVNLVGMHDVLAPSAKDLTLKWWMRTPHVEKDVESQTTNSTIYYKPKNEEADKLSEHEDTKESLENPIEWLSFKQKFFSSVIIAQGVFEKPVELESKKVENSTTSIKDFYATVSIPFKHLPSESISMKMYFGPNHYQTLKKYDIGLEQQIPLGWGIFGWVNKFIVIPLFNFLDSFNMNYGIVILVLTIVIKLILFPLTYKAYLSQAKMRVLKPEMDEINEKFGNDDPMKKQQAIMSLYKQAGVNPLGGCLPMLLQMPILIALFNFFPASIELRGESFLWADDLSTYDSIYNLPFTIPFYGDHVSLFTLLMTASTILYTRMNSDLSGNAQMAQMKWMMYLMPIIFLGVLNNYSSGLSYYYFLANVITFGQQWAMRKFVNEDAIHARIQENKKKPVQKSKLQQKLEEMAKRQQQLPKKK